MTVDAMAKRLQGVCRAANARFCREADALPVADPCSVTGTGPFPIKPRQAPERVPRTAGEASAADCRTGRPPGPGFGPKHVHVA